MAEQNYADETYQNTPNVSLMFTMYTPTFGNGNFAMQLPSPGEVSQNFPTVPYLPLEALIYEQISSNPSTSPVNSLGGATSGQQVIKGQYTMQDSTTTSRYMQGFQSVNQ